MQNAFEGTETEPIAQGSTCVTDLLISSKASLNPLSKNNSLK